MAQPPKKGDPQAQVVKAQRAEDGRKAMAEYEAAAVATRAKTEKLKALRLAREAEEALNAPPAAAKKAPKAKAASGGAKKAPAKKKSASLSSFLKDKSESGHRS